VGAYLCVSPGAHKGCFVFSGMDSCVRERTPGRWNARRIITNPQPTIEDAVTLHV
jgi:hypothetical protein